MIRNRFYGRWRPPRTKYRGGSVWTPKSLPGLKAWHRADQVTTAAGPVVSAIADKSGNGHTLHQTSGSNRPTWNESNADGNDRPSVDFDGVNDFLEEVSADGIAPGIEPWEVIVVLYAATAATISTIVSNEPATDGQGLSLIGGVVGDRLRTVGDSGTGGARGFDDQTSLADGNLYYLRGTYDGVEDLASFIDGVNSAPATTAGMDGGVGFASGETFKLARKGSNYGLFDWFETIVIAGTSLSAENRALLAAYLDERYGRSVGTV